MESPRKMSVQNRPMTRQIQPTGFLGCLEAIRAPTMGKARKETKINSSPRVSPVLVGSCDERVRTCSTTLARNMATQRPASDQASQEAARDLIPSTPRSCSVSPSLTTPLYRRTISQTLRLALRERRAAANFLERRVCELRRILLPRTLVNGLTVGLHRKPFADSFPI